MTKKARIYYEEKTVSSISDAGKLDFVVQSLSCALCLTLCKPMDYSLPGSSVHGIFQVIIPFPCPGKLYAAAKSLQSCRIATCKSMKLQHSLKNKNKLEMD